MVVKILVGAALLLLAGFLLLMRRAWQGTAHFLNGLRDWFGG